MMQGLRLSSEYLVYCAKESGCEEQTNLSYISLLKAISYNQAILARNFKKTINT